MSNLVPIVVEKTPNGERSYDIYSRLLRDRIIMFTGEVSESSCNLAIAQLLFLRAEDDSSDINLYIQSPGGSVYAGLSLASTIDLINKSPSKGKVNTIGMGMCASMGAFLLSCGHKRTAIPNTTIMIHQVLTGVAPHTQATDIQIQNDETQRLKKLLTQRLAENCGKTYDELYEACERDNYMSETEAKDFGLINDIFSY